MPPTKLARFAPDPYIMALLACVVLASVLPCRGDAAKALGMLTDAAIVLLFFLHGAKLSREAVLQGAGHWRLHLLVLGSTFVLFPVLGLVARAVAEPIIAPALAAGLLFLCLLPSTVQSSIAFTAVAKGNVAAAVCSASASNLIGILITPILAHLFLPEFSAGREAGAAWGQVRDISLQLLLPFILGHLSRPLTAGWIGRRKKLVMLVDRGSILLVVYTAFSAAVVGGLWSRLSGLDLTVVVLLCIAIFATALAATMSAARLLGFSKADETVIVFCGAKKSLATGVPMAGVLFPAAVVGPMILPLMIFHQIELMTGAFLARRYGRAAEAETTVSGATR